MSFVRSCFAKACECHRRCVSSVGALKTKTAALQKKTRKLPACFRVHQTIIFTFSGNTRASMSDSKLCALKCVQRKLASLGIASLLEQAHCDTIITIGE